MYECPNCGMLPYACVCVPWCSRHDRPEPCAACKTDPAPDKDELDPLLVAIPFLCGFLLIAFGLLLDRCG